MLQLPCMHHMIEPLTAALCGSRSSKHTVRFKLCSHAMLKQTHTHGEQIETPSSGRTVSQHRSVALAAIDRRKNVWEEGGRGGERVYAEISNDTAFYRHKFPSPVSECVVGTVPHKSRASLQWTEPNCSNCLCLKSGKVTGCIGCIYILYNRGTLSPSPSYPNLPPVESWQPLAFSCMTPHYVTRIA